MGIFSYDLIIVGCCKNILEATAALAACGVPSANNDRSQRFIFNGFIILAVLIFIQKKQRSHHHMFYLHSTSCFFLVLCCFFIKQITSGFPLFFQ